MKRLRSQGKTPWVWYEKHWTELIEPRAKGFTTRFKTFTEYESCFGDSHFSWSPDSMREPDHLPIHLTNLDTNMVFQKEKMWMCSSTETC